MMIIIIIQYMKDGRRNINTPFITPQLAIDHNYIKNYLFIILFIYLDIS